MIGAIVLAAGSGIRAGGPKDALRIGDRTFLQAILRTLADAGVGTVRVVVAPGNSPAGVECLRLVVNPDPSRGMLSSVQCGIEALPPGVGAALLWPVDHPLAGAATVRALEAAWRTSGAPVVVPVHAGKRGHPALFAAAVFPDLLKAPRDEGARAIVLAHADRVELPVDDPGVLADIDTPDDYARARGERPPSAETPR